MARYSTWWNFNSNRTRMARAKVAMQILHPERFAHIWQRHEWLYIDRATARLLWENDADAWKALKTHVLDIMDNQSGGVTTEVSVRLHGRIAPVAVIRREELP